MSQADVERLRRTLQGCVPGSYGKDRVWWDSLSPEWQAWEIANMGIGRLLGYQRAAQDPDNHDRAHDTETLRLEAKDHGFRTSEDFVAALVGLRDQLRRELAPEVWDTFFAPTLDIT